MSEIKEMAERLDQAVHQGTNTAEEIHRDVAGLPITLLENLGLEQETASEIRRVHEASISAVYDAIRNVNHKVSELVQDLLDPDQAEAS